MRVGSLLSAGEYALVMDRPSQATRAQLVTALVVAEAIGDRQHMAYALTLLAWAAADAGTARRGGPAVGCDRGRIGAQPVRPMGARSATNTLATLEVAAGPDFDRGRVEGASLTFDEAVEEALAT